MVPVFARVTRGAALQVRSRDYILAARMAGKGEARIAAEHVLPNILGQIVVQAAIQLALAILTEAGLSYLGLGIAPPAPSWGRMLADSQTYLEQAPHLAVAPGHCHRAGGARVQPPRRRAARPPRPAARGSTPDAQTCLLSSTSWPCRSTSRPERGPGPARRRCRLVPTSGAGETLGVVGESGSGKSMLSLAHPRPCCPDQRVRAAGSIVFDGEDLLGLAGDVGSAPFAGRRIGMVFQEPMTALNPSMAVGDQIGEGLRLHHGLSRAAALGRSPAASRSASAFGEARAATHGLPA